MTTISGPEGMEFFQLLQFRARLSIEIKTGMRSRQPTLRLYNEEFGTNFSRKQQALEDVEKRIQRSKLEMLLRQAHRTHVPAEPHPVTELTCDERGCAICNLSEDEFVESMMKAWEEGRDLGLDVDWKKDPSQPKGSGVTLPLGPPRTPGSKVER